MNETLKIAILRSGKTQIGLARQLGISESRLSRIVNGWDYPNPVEQHDIAEALGIPLHILFSDIQQDVGQ